MQKWNIILIKTQPPITRENEKEMKKVINRDRVTLTAGHLTYTTSFGTQSHLAERWMLPHPLGHENWRSGSQVINPGHRTGKNLSQDSKVGPTPQSLLLCYSTPFLGPSSIPLLRSKSLCTHALNSLHLFAHCLLIWDLLWKISCRDFT